MLRTLFVLALSSALALSGCWQGVTRSVSATVLSTRGEIAYSENGSAPFQPLTSQTTLNVGSVVRTSRDAELDLMFVPGVVAQLSADSELKLLELKITKDGNETGDAIGERVASLDLSQGEVTVLFEGFARFAFKTPHCAFRVPPSCLFRVNVDRNRTRLTCVRGKIYVTSQKFPLAAVETGQFQEWPSNRGSVSVTEDLQSQKDTTEILQIGRELGELQAARRDRLPF